jgi:hypothetical protein
MQVQLLNDLKAWVRQFRWNALIDQMHVIGTWLTL